MQDLLFISVFDYGSRELGLNHLESLKKCNITNYLACIADKKTYDYIKKAGHPLELIENADFSTTRKHFGEKDFIEFSFLRYKLIRDCLKKHKAVWYLDVDTVVLDDLNKKYLEYVDKGYDIVFQNDLHNARNCTGCMLYFSTPKTINMVDHVYKGMNFDMPDQHFVNFFLAQNQGAFKTTLFDFCSFPNGLIYFDDEDKIAIPPEYMEYKIKFRANKKKHVVFVHANWMVGIEEKMNAMKRKGLWYIER
jgi:hypothetical protein